MGELIAALVQALVAVVTGFLEILPVILEGLLYVVVAAFTIVAYAISPRFRQKKRVEWARQRWRKYLDLGISGTCLGLLAAVAIWMALPSPKRASKPQIVQSERPMADEDRRWTVKGEVTKGATNDITIIVKKDGTKRILATGTLKELENAIRENVTVLTNKQAGVSVGQPIHSDRTEAAAAIRR